MFHIHCNLWKHLSVTSEIRRIGLWLKILPIIPHSTTTVLLPAPSLLPTVQEIPRILRTLHTLWSGNALPFVLCGHMFMLIIEAISQLMAYGLHNLNVFTVSFHFIQLTDGPLGSWLWNWILYQLHCWKWQSLITYHPDKIKVTSHCSWWSPCSLYAQWVTSGGTIRRCGSRSLDRCSSDLLPVFEKKYQWKGNIGYSYCKE